MTLVTPPRVSPFKKYLETEAFLLSIRDDKMIMLSDVLYLQKIRGERRTNTCDCEDKLRNIVSLNYAGMTSSSCSFRLT